MNDDNPLRTIPYRIPFDRIRAEHVQPAVTRLLEEARARRAAVGSGNGQRTYANTMEALDKLTEPLDYAMGVVRHLESVATYPELRAAFNAVQPEVSAFYSGIPLDAALWQAREDLRRQLRKAAALDGERRRFLTKTVDPTSAGTARISTPPARGNSKRSTSS